jgi:hypothetical protein
MKTPRVSDFDPNAKRHTLKSSMGDFPAIQKPKVVTRPESIPPPSKTSPQPIIPPVPKRVPVPPPVPRTPFKLIPKVKRAIRQRQPFDIYEDQYKRLKEIAASEKEFENGRGMSQMVRDAIDKYLSELDTSS